MSRERGLSLVELMIAMLISLLILAGLTQIFSMNRRTYQSDEGIARLQENARFAVDFLTRDIRSAGSMGCMSTEIMRSKQKSNASPFPENSTGSTLNIAAAIPAAVGYDATDIAATDTSYTLPKLYPPTLTAKTTPAMDSTLAPVSGIVPGSDAILLRGMETAPVGFLAKPTATQIVVPDTTTISNGQILLITDCTNAAVVVKVLNKSSGGGYTTLTLTPTERLDKIPRYQAQAGAMRNIIYYVGQGSNGGPSLFSRNFSDGVGTPQELVEGVETMQFLYGIDTSCVPGDRRGTACTYQHAESVVDWNRVRSIRVAMLVASSNVVTTQDYDSNTNAGGMESSVDANTYTMQGVTLTPNSDRRRRRVFETTINLRNETIPPN